MRADADARRSCREMLMNSPSDLSFLHYLARFVAHLPENGDKELSLLKCHLMIEEVLTVIIERHMVRPEFLQKAARDGRDLRFQDKLLLAKCLTLSSEDDWIWKAIAALNAARNRLAHRLDRKEVDAKLEEFMNCVERSVKEGPPPADAFVGKMQRFQLCACRLFMETVHRAEVDPSDIRIKDILGDRAT